MSAAISRTQLPHEVASELGISADTVGRYARDGLIPFSTTPKGHRRYNVDEVREALAAVQSLGVSRVAASNVVRGNRLVPGPSVTISPQSRLREELRATRTKAQEGSRDMPARRSSGSVIDEMLDHAKRVLVAS